MEKTLETLKNEEQQRIENINVGLLKGIGKIFLSNHKDQDSILCIMYLFQNILNLIVSGQLSLVILTYSSSVTFRINLVVVIIMTIMTQVTNDVLSRLCLKHDFLVLRSC